MLPHSINYHNIGGQDMKHLFKKLRGLSVALIVTAVFLLTVVLSQISVESSETQGELYVSKFPTVILDPGHGGIDGGCVAVNGVSEKGINLSIALYTRDILASMGYEVVLTRETDVSIHDKGVNGVGNQKKSDMKNRLSLINSYENAVAVSIHQNQFTDSSYSGAQMFYSNTNDLSEALASSVQASFVRYLQPENTREIKEIGNDLYLLYNANCPMIMAECGFLSNENESELLQDEQYQRKVAFTIAASIAEFIDENY